MSNRDSEEIFMKFHISKNQSNYKQFEKKLKENLFYMFFLLMKENESNFILECVSIIFQYLQMMYFPFDTYVKIIYKILV